MVRNILIALFILPVLSSSIIGQETSYAPGYQTMISSNPALAGIEGDAKLRVSYMNFYPGKNYNFHSVFASYDSYYSVIHGGAAIYFSDDYLGGILNEMRGGFAYSYFLQAGEDLFINAGLSASFFHRGFNFSGAILPDQIDPVRGVVNPSSQAISMPGRTVFDVGAGFAFISGRINGGLAVNHLAQPDISGAGSYDQRLKRKLLIHLAGDFDLNSETGLQLSPVTFAEFQGSYLSAGLGTAFESKSLSINTMVILNNEDAIDLQTGFSVATGKILFFYNYRFNLSSGYDMKPFSLMHQTGITIGLNSVDKRKRSKTINFPKM